jgi:sulfur-carrier protein
MASVWIPSLMRELTGGQSVVEVPAGTVGEAIERMEAQYPGVKARLLEGERLRPGIVVVVDGVTSSRKLRHRLTETSEVHFLPAIGGGSRS